MKRKSQNRKLYKTIMLFSIFQLFFLLFSFFAFDSIEFANMNNTEKIIFKADNVEICEGISIGRHSPNNTRIIIHYNSNEYRYGVKNFSKYHGIDLIEKLSNEELSVVYLTTSKQIVDIKSNGLVFYTIDNYNAQQTCQLIAGIVLFSIIEIFFLAILFLYLLVDGKGIKFLQPLKKRKIRTSKE